MIAVYVQDRQAAICKYRYHHPSNSSTEAIKYGIENNKLAPGDLAMTMQVGQDGKLEIIRVIKHWAIYVLHDQIEAVPDRVGVLLKPTGWRYYRDYMKFGRMKSVWYWTLKRKV
jgi:hypothetical protein